MATENLLSKAKVITAKCPSGKRYKWFSDGNGLLLRVENTGKKVWVARLFSSDVNDGKETKRGIGSYPTIALKEARIIRDEYKKLWAKGIDPSIEKKKSKLAVNKSKVLMPKNDRSIKIVGSINKKIRNIFIIF